MMRLTLWICRLFLRRYDARFVGVYRFEKGAQLIYTDQHPRLITHDMRHLWPQEDTP